MQCRLIEATVAADRMGQAFEGLEANVVPRLKTLPGYRGAYWLADRTAGKMYAATFYDSKQSLDESRAMAQQIRTEGMEAGGVHFDRVTEFEVVANTGEKISTTATHARVTRTKNDPGRFDAATEAIKSTVIPETRAMKGSQGGFWLAERESGEGFGATLWDSADAMNATTAQGEEMRKRVTGNIGAQVTGVLQLEIALRAETPG
ncbi:MAG TPA: hypothetical protein VGR61_08945 [Candidatus Dormibacteraeota bacterium]|nr:hypothetical protein [Candidatus Dormibacteraeota bacterium]